MKKHVSLLAILLIYSGCDSPQRTRAVATQSSSNLGTVTTIPGTTTGTTTPWTIPGSTAGSSGSSTTSGFEVCDLSARFQTSDIGAFGLCQNTLDETLLRFKPSMTNTSFRTCLIPTYKEANGSSTYIGQPQCTYTQSGNVVQGKLYKNRNGFESYQINGVIVMNENLLTGYFGCMNAYASYVSPACPGGARTSGNCDMAAQAYRDQVCGSFINQYGRNYADIRLK